MSPRTAAATAAVQQNAARRAAQDPQKLARAVRTVRSAVSLKLLTTDELLQEDELEDNR